MIRVVVTGSECTGKTTLATALAAELGAPLVQEYAREFVIEKGSAPERSDVDAIARGQIAAENAAIEQLAGRPAAAQLIVQDTDLLSTIVYSHHYYGACPEWIERQLRLRAADLYLLAGIDVPWIADGEQRDRGDRREEMQALFHDALVTRGLPFAPLAGSLADRLATARAALARL
jgi:NadR type nicotinamide-nucleotide adenylyltransferase